MRTGHIAIMKEKLSSGIRVILLDYQNVEWLGLLCGELIKNHISNVEIWHCMEYVSECDMVRRISPKEMDEVLEVYRMYEFSDKVMLISDSVQHGSLINYVKTGIITKEEMVEALLGEI